MVTIARLRDLDARAWEVATWATPFVAPLMVGMAPLTYTMLEQWPFLADRDSTLMATAAIVNMAIALLLVLLLLTSRSSVARGWAASIAGVSVVVVIGAVAFAFLFTMRTAWTALGGAGAVALAGGYAFASLVFTYSGQRPVRFVATVLNMLAMLLPMTVLLVSGGIVGVAFFFSGYFLLDLVVAVVFAFQHGTLREIGRGMLIATLSVPVGLVVLIGGAIVGHQIF